MRAWTGWLLCAGIAASGCVSHSNGDHEDRTSRGQLEHTLGARPTRILPVGGDRALVVWEFHRLWPELGPEIERFVALEDSGHWILWWVRYPELGPSFDETGLIDSLPWLLSADRAPQDREERLAQLGLLGD